MLNSLIADSITRIRNGYSAKLQEIELCYSKFIVSFLEVLKEEGYIDEYEIYSEGNKNTIGVKLKYVKNRAAIKKIQCVSKPGQRIYVKHNKIPIVASGFGNVILSTNKGLMASRKALETNTGGELLATIF